MRVGLHQVASSAVCLFSIFVFMMLQYSSVWVYPIKQPGRSCRNMSTDVRFVRVIADEAARHKPVFGKPFNLPPPDPEIAGSDNAK